MASEDLLEKAVAAFNALSPEQQHEMMEEQRQSWVRGNIGLSRDERDMTSPMMSALKTIREENSIGRQAVKAWADSKTRPTPVAPVSPDATGEPWPYQKTFNAIAAATRLEGGCIFISVKDFVEAFGPTPDATGKCGELETVHTQVRFDAKDVWRNEVFVGERSRITEKRELVTRSQAVELLAAERAENTRLQSENDAQADQISELQMTPWPEWATKVLAVIRKRSGYDGYGDAIEGVDLPAELDECIAAIEADNAALTARINELETERTMIVSHATMGDTDGTGLTVNDVSVRITALRNKLYNEGKKQSEALEAKLAAAEKIRIAAIELDAAISDDFNIFGAQQKLRAALGGKPS